MNRLLLRHPFEDINTLNNSLINSFFQDMFEDFRKPKTFINQPSTDISYSDDGKKLHIEIEIAGYDRDDIQMNINHNILEITGTKKQKEEHRDKGRNYMVRESSTSFSRRIVLPDGVNSDKITAKLTNGILDVTIPVDRPEAKRIEIEEPKSTRKAKLTSLTDSKEDNK